MDVARCMLNGAVLPKSLWGELATTAVFRLKRPPSKTVGGHTSYYKTFGKHVDIFFVCTIWTRLNEDRQAHLAITSRHIRSFSSPTVETATSSSSTSATLHTAPAASKRRGLHQGAYTFSLGGHPLQRPCLL